MQQIELSNVEISLIVRLLTINRESLESIFKRRFWLPRVPNSIDLGLAHELELTVRLVKKLDEL